MASVLAVGDFFLNNLLDDLGMNPTWEKWRRYGFAGCVAMSLFPLYLTLNGIPLHCTPAYENGTIIEGVKFSSPEAATVNALCSNDISLWSLRYCGCILMTMNLAALFVSSCWLHSSNVIDAFRTFAKWRDLILECNEAIELIRSRVSSPLPEKDSHKNSKSLREACRLISLVKPKSDVRLLYCIRNIILTFILIFECIGALVVTIFVGNIEVDFLCNSFNRSYSCPQNIGTSTLIFSISFVLGTFVQAVTVLWGICKTKNSFEGSTTNRGCCCCYSYCCTKRDLFGKEIAYFMVNLWENAQPSNSKILRDVIEYLFSEAFSDSVKLEAKRIIQHKDIELLRLREISSTNNFNEIFAPFTFYDRGFDIEFFTSVAKVVKYDIDSCHKFLKWVIRREYWDLLVIFLNYTDRALTCSDETKEFLKQQKVNFDSFGCYSDCLNGSSEKLIGSLLHYAIKAESLSESDNKTGAKDLKTPHGPIPVALFLFENLVYNWPVNGGPFLHSCEIGHKEDESTYFVAYLEKMSKDITDTKDWKKLWNTTRLCRQGSYLCQDEMINPKYNEVLAEVGGQSQRAGGGDDYDKKHKDFMEKFANKKFHTWTKKMTDLLECLERNVNEGERKEYHCRALVTLLNAYIMEKPCILKSRSKYPDIKIASNNDNNFVKQIVNAFIWKSPLGYISRGPKHIIKFVTTMQRIEIKRHLEIELRKLRDSSDHDDLEQHLDKLIKSATEVLNAENREQNTSGENPAAPIWTVSNAESSATPEAQGQEVTAEHQTTLLPPASNASGDSETDRLIPENSSPSGTMATAANIQSGATPEPQDQGVTTQDQIPHGLRARSSTVPTIASTGSSSSSSSSSNSSSFDSSSAA